MGALNQLISRVTGGGARRTGGTGGTGLGGGTTGHTGASGGTRSQDEAIGRGVRSLLGKLGGRRR